MDFTKTLPSNLILIDKNQVSVDTPSGRCCTLTIYVSPGLRYTGENTYVTICGGEGREGRCETGLYQA